MDEISNSEKELLRTRVLEAKKNDFPGRPADDVLTEIENKESGEQNEQGQSAT